MSGYRSVTVKPERAPSATEIRQMIRHEGTVTEAAAAFNVSRQSMYRWMRKHGIAIERRSRPIHRDEAAGVREDAPIALYPDGPPDAA